MTEKPGQCLLAVVAHPDDETFGCGGLLAKCAAEGVRVVLMCGTRGEAGEISYPSLATPENLGEVREGELREAAAALGIKELHILGYRDSGMAGTSDNHHERALCRADRDEVAGRIVDVMRRVRPQVVVTFDPKGGYGHPDHIAIHEATYDAFHAAGDPSRYPGGADRGPGPYEPLRLYYFVFPRSSVRALRAAVREAGIESDMADIDPESMGTPDEEITTVIDVGDQAEKKERAARCHRTQTLGDDAFTWIPEPLRTSFLSTEHLVRAEPHVSPGEPKEEHIFGSRADSR